MAISWILASLEPIIIDCVLDYTTAHELWTWIHTFFRPISLPSVNDPIQCEVAKGRNIGNKEEEENLKLGINNQTQNRDQDPRNQGLNEKILNKGTDNLLGVTDSTTTTNTSVHGELKVENNEKEEFSSKVRSTEETVNEESNILFPHLIPFYMKAQNNKTLPHQIPVTHFFTQPMFFVSSQPNSLHSFTIQLM